jgi:uncharacterized membrane protein YdfJ with MMPL/SSD domain
MRSVLILVPVTLAALAAIHGLSPAKRASRQNQWTETLWSRFVIAITNPDLVAVVAFCLVGLLLSLNLILRFPDFGAVIEQYNQF